ncbi:MAG TPA: hypothetical protein VII01_18215, partial [Solirubrobacteraceae bacterium]
MTKSGRVGPLMLHRSTLTDVVGFAGQPDSERDSATYDVKELGYGCKWISGYPDCETTFYLTLGSGTLIEFWTKSIHYTALGGIRVG